MTKSSKVYLIPTIIADHTAEAVIPAQVKECIINTEYFFAEELRTARRFISSLKLGKPIENLKFFELSKDTSRENMIRDFDSVPAGENIGILSEAGCPGIADPGSLAVEYAHKKGCEVIPLVGPSSILLALMASGFNGQSFVFHGYIPLEKTERTKFIKSIERDAITKNQTQIFMDTPYRNNKLLEDLLNACAPDTRICVAADITGEKQFIKSYQVKDWKNNIPDIHKLPAMFLLFRS